jgi:hypothetical protein
VLRSVEESLGTAQLDGTVTVTLVEDGTVGGVGKEEVSILAVGGATVYEVSDSS